MDMTLIQCTYDRISNRISSFVKQGRPPGDKLYFNILVLQSVLQSLNTLLLLRSCCVSTTAGYFPKLQVECLHEVPVPVCATAILKEDDDTFRLDQYASFFPLLLLTSEILE